MQTNNKMDNINKYTTHDSHPGKGFVVGIIPASKKDYSVILEIQKKAFRSEAELYQNFNIQPLIQTLDEMEEECRKKTVLKAIVDGKIVGSIRANIHEKVCWVNKLVVLPDFQRKGIGKKLLTGIETYFPDAIKFTLATGTKSESNIRLYKKVGYEVTGYETFHDGVEAVVMEKGNGHPLTP